VTDQQQGVTDLCHVMKSRGCDLDPEDCRGVIGHVVIGLF